MRRLNFFLHTNAMLIFSIFIGVIFIPGILYYTKLISFSFFQLFSMGAGFFYILWIYIVGKNLHHKLPAGMTLNIGLFKMGCFFAIVLMFLWSLLFNSYDTMFYLFLNFILVYLIYFVSKSIVSIENKKEMFFGDSLGVFLTIWLFPIGIWFIQPRVQKIFIEKES